MKLKSFLLIVPALIVSACSFENYYRMGYQKSVHPYEQINFVELVKKYMDKNEKAAPGNIEGIYTVSSVVLKKSKGLFSSEEHERTVDQKDHYAQVAILRDNARNNREYIEVPIDKNYLASYSVRGEFTTLAEGNILVLKHFEPKNKVLTYAFTYDQEKDMLEGVRTETSGNTTYTYKLTFVKLYPKVAVAHN
jgi:hypothetical protein